MELSAMGAAPQPTRREQRAQPGSSLGHSAEQRQAAAGELLRQRRASFQNRIYL